MASAENMPTVQEAVEKAGLSFEHECNERSKDDSFLFVGCKGDLYNAVVQSGHLDLTRIMDGKVTRANIPLDKLLLHSCYAHLID